MSDSLREKARRAFAKRELKRELEAIEKLYIDAKVIFESGLKHVGQLEADLQKLTPGVVGWSKYGQQVAGLKGQIEACREHINGPCRHQLGWATGERERLRRELDLGERERAEAERRAKEASAKATLDAARAEQARAAAAEAEEQAMLEKVDRGEIAI